MGNFFADLENSMTDAPPEGEASDEGQELEGETEAPEVPEGAEQVAAPDGEEEPGSELDEDEEIDLGAEKLTRKQLREERLMRADYTKKTQQLAELRRETQAQLEMVSEENEELKDWIGSLGDVESMAFELERYYPDTYQALRDKIHQELLEEQDLDEASLNLLRRAHKAEMAEKARQKDEERSKKYQEKSEYAKKTAELAKTFDTWLTETMEPTGLDPKSEKHQRLVRNELRGSYRDKKWTKEIFQAACKTVAEDLGLQPPVKKVDGKPALPPTKGSGAKAPAKDKNKPRLGQKKPTKYTDETFASIRAKYGA